MTTCRSCGAENPAEFRFCGSCGSALAEATPTRELRKTVTVLFCDVVGSTALGESVDPEPLRRLMGSYYEQMRTIVERHGGTVEKFIGDAVMAVFGVPRTHEDDALRAVRAAAEMQAAAVSLELEIRIGVNTGEVVTGEGETLVTGDAVNVAARLEQAAQAGEILIGDATRQLAEGALEIKPIQPVQAKGKSAPVVAFRVIDVRADAPAFERRFDAPFVGRGGELEQLVQAYARAVRDSSCQLFTVLGPAGIGKSRLVLEFVDLQPDAIVLRGRCLAYGDGITYFPLVEILEQIAADVELGRVLAADHEARGLLNTVSAAIGLADEEVVTREDTFRAVRKLFEALAASRPLILVLDDVHWAEPTLLDLVDHVADLSRGAPILLLCMARPEFLDSRPGWGGGKMNAATILLEPLSEDEAETLIENLLVGADLSEHVRQRITASAEGNPLFVEQMLALLAQNGGNGNGDVVVPPTIQALLATRLEQLPSGERIAAERASVIGKEFWRNALLEIGGELSALPGLVRKELIRPHRSPIFPTDDAYRFRHQLIRDAAYDGMPKELRAQLHERFGRWLEATRSEFDEIVGYHFEQAFTLKEQLGRVDDALEAVGVRAGHLLGRAGQRAYERGDTPAAINLLSRGTRLLPERDTRRLEQLVNLGHAQHDAGELQQAIATFAEAIDEAREAGEEALESRAVIGQIFVEVLTGGAFGVPLDRTKAEIEKLERLQDDAGLAEAWYLAASLESWLGRSSNGAAHYERAIEHARRAGNRRLSVLPVGVGTLMQAWGSMPAPDGLRECDRLLGEHAGTSIEAPLRTARAMHLSLLGEHEAAAKDQALGEELFEQFGNQLMRAAAHMSRADKEIRAGRPEAAEVAASAGVELLEALGEQGFLSSTVGQLAEALYRQGRYDEAEEAARKTAHLAMEDDFDPEFRSRAVLARVLAQRGEFEEAEKLAREAVEVVEQTDWYLQRGQALAALGEVLELAGRADEARRSYEQAIESFERKGSLPEVDATRRRLAELA